LLHPRGVAPLEAAVECGGGIAQTALAQDGLLLEEEFEEVGEPDPVRVPRPDAEVARRAERGDGVVDGGLDLACARAV